MIKPAFILAISDTATYGMFAVSTFVSLLTGGFMVILFRAQDANAKVVSNLSEKLDNADQRRREEVQKLSDDLHDANTKLIDSRFRDVTHQVKDHAQAMTATMDLVTKRVAASEEKLSEIGEARHQAQLELTKAVADLREFVRECSVSRAEFTEIKASIKELQTTVAKVDRDSITLDDLRRVVREANRE